MEFIPKYIKQVMDWRDSEKITAEQYNAILNLLIVQGDNNSEYLNFIAGNHLTEEEVRQLINQKVFEVSGADMTQAVYDNNHNGIVDYAEQTVDNGVKTQHIENEAVTEEKLSQQLQKRLIYLYNKISEILIMIGADSEIEGGEGMLTFGWDSELNSGYRIDTSLHMSTSGINTLASGGTKIICPNLTKALSTNKEYSIGNSYYSYFTSKISSTTLKSYNKSGNLVLMPADSNVTYKYTPKIFHLEGDYFAYIVNGYDGNSSYYWSYLTMYIIKVNSNRTITTITSKTETRSDLKGCMKVGDAVYVMSAYTDENAIYKAHRITSSGITTILNDLGADHSADKGFAVYESYMYTLQYDSGDSSFEVHRNNKTTGVTSAIATFSFDSITTNLRQLSAKWAVAVYRYNSVYYQLWVDLVNATCTTVNLGSTDTSDSAITNYLVMAPSGNYFYATTGKYYLNDSTRAITRALSMTVTSALVPIDDDKYSINGVLYNKGSIIFRDPADNYTKTTGSETVSLFNIVYNSDLTCGIIATGKTGSSGNAYAEAFTFNLPSVTLATAAPQSITSPYIKREADCIVSTNHRSVIYLDVANADSNVFTDLSLIIKTDRAVTASDTLEVYYNTTANESFTKLTALSSSTDTTKYYEVTGQSSTIWTIKVIAQASGSALTLTNILGGVDSGV